MNEELYNNSKFKQNLDTSREKTIELLKEKFESAKVELFKNALKEENIVVSEQIQDVQTLIEEVQSQYGSEKTAIIIEKFSFIEQKMSDMLYELESGSLTGLHKFFRNMKDGISGIFSSDKEDSSIMEAVEEEKLASQVQDDKSKKDRALDMILQELEVTKGVDNEILDTRFSPEMQEKIRSFLTSQHIYFDDTGYLSLRDKIYSLDFDQKLKVCNFINSTLGYKINVEGDLEKYTHSDFWRNRLNDIEDVGKASGFGFAIAEVINSIDPAILSAPINGILTKELVESLTNSAFVGNLSGFLVGAGTPFAKLIPVAGPLFEKIFAANNIVVSTVTGAAVGLSFVAFRIIYRLIKQYISRLKYNKDLSQIANFDFEKYAEDNSKEIQMIQEKKSVTENNVDSFITDFFVDFLIENNIEFETKPSNLEELKTFISTLNSEDKKKVQKFISAIKKEEKDDFSSLLELKKKANNLEQMGLCEVSPYQLYEMEKKASLADSLQNEFTLEGAKAL